MPKVERRQAFHAARCWVKYARQHDPGPSDLAASLLFEACDHDPRYAMAYIHDALVQAGLFSEPRGEM